MHHKHGVLKGVGSGEGASVNSPAFFSLHFKCLLAVDLRAYYVKGMEANCFQFQPGGDFFTLGDCYLS